ncbi:MAG: peptide-methionine (S)-S-oxide reductase MsrA [Candidatus Saccharimonadales bacterium]
MIKRMVLGGGCFWGMQELIRARPGIIKTWAGYSGGKVKNPTYENHAGHVEVLQIEYDDNETSFQDILDFFFQIHDPTTLNRQGNDIGSSYRSVIFYANEDEKRQAKDFIDIVNKSGRWKDPVITTLEPLDKFYVAEGYHQDYLQKHPDGYTCHFIRFSSYI